MEIKKNYRWDIQGLRALAVLAVVIFHIAPNRLPGGYLGVDIFFVISGYLIIGFICRDVFAEKFNFTDFYVKRIKRLFPALFATVLATSVGAYFLLLPEETTVYAKSAISTLLYVSNMFFYTQSDYFAADLELAPLLHTWSLSVEEQFYILFPILLVAIIKCKPQYLQKALISIAILSFILSEYLVRTDPSLAFFISPTRFWQFIAGGLLALNIHKSGLSQLTSNIMGAVGMLTLIACLFAYCEETVFPGINAIIPTLATLLVIWAGNAESLFSRLMALPINRFFGNISYSLYLWHWPVIVFYSLAINNQYSIMANNIIILATSIVLGYLSWKYVEIPFSKKNSRAEPQQTFITTLAISATVIAIMAFSLNGLPHRFNEQQLYFSSYMNYKQPGFKSGTCFLTKSTADIHLYNKEECIKFDKNKANILLIGDSHAAHLNSALQELIPKTHTLTQITASGCRPVEPMSGSQYCIDFINFGIKKVIPNKRFEKVIIAARWKVEDLPKLKRMIEYLKPLTNDIVIVGRTLEYYQYLPRVLATTEVTDIENDTQNRYTELKNLDIKFKSLADKEDVAYISLINILCAPDTHPCKSITKGGVPIAFDYGHFTHEGAVEAAKVFVNHLLKDK